jgi:hypothetical protein
MIEKYLNKEISPKRLPLEKRMMESIIDPDNNKTE